MLGGIAYCGRAAAPGRLIGASPWPNRTKPPSLALRILDVERDDAIVVRGEKGDGTERAHRPLGDTTR